MLKNKLKNKTSPGKPWLRRILIAGGLAALGLLSAGLALRLAIKSGEVTLPDIEGQNIVTALEQLNSLNLRLEIEDQQFHNKIPLNHIITQRPAGNSRIKSGRKVKIVLSRGAKRISVPSLAGKSWYEAQTILRKKGFAVGRISNVYHSEPAQKILGQSPPAGTLISTGEKVNLLLSRGPRPDFYLMPDFMGQELSQVRRQLKIIKLSSGRIKHKVYQGVSPGIVVNQSPPAGFRIQQGKSVDLTVSQAGT